MEKNGSAPHAPPSYDDVVNSSSPSAPQPIQAGYYPAVATSSHPQVNYQVVIQQAPTGIVTPGPVKLTAGRMQIYCPTCRSLVTSKTSHESGSLAWLSCCLIFIFGGFLFCCLIPFCCDACRNVRHRCPVCKSCLGIYKRL